LQFDLLTLPFIGGYVFYTRFSFFAYSAVRAVGQHLLLRSALCGFFLLLISRALIFGAPFVEAESDRFLAGAMAPVPGLAFLAALGAFEYSNVTNTGKFSRVFRRPKGVWLLLIALGLLTLASLIAATAPDNKIWLFASAVGVLVTVLSAWTLHSYTRTNFNLALFRVSWFLLIFVLVVAVSAAYGKRLDTLWLQFSPVKDSGTPALALLIGVLAWYPLNLLIPYKTALERFHSLGYSDAMDRFLFDAAETKALLQLTLSDGKFYVGQVKSLAANPVAPSSFVRVLPYASGYRNKDTKELVFTCFYQDVYDELVDEPGFTEESLNQFIKILPFGAIFSANLFDSDMYMRFQIEQTATTTTEDGGEMAGG
jgi:hypothetical protein